MAKEGIKSAADLKGKTFGTFQADTLEVLPYDYLVIATGPELAFDEIEQANQTEAEKAAKRLAELESRAAAPAASCRPS